MSVSMNIKYYQTEEKSHKHYGCKSLPQIINYKNKKYSTKKQPSLLNSFKKNYINIILIIL